MSNNEIKSIDFLKNHLITFETEYNKEKELKVVQLKKLMEQKELMTNKIK